MRGAGPGQAADDDRRDDPLVEDLGVASDQVLNEESVLQQPEDEDVLLHDAGAVEAPFLAHGTTQQLETLDEVLCAVVVQSGLGAAAAISSAGSSVSCDPASSMKSRIGAHLVAVAGHGQVVDADGRGAGAHTVPTGTTSTWGCSGVASGRNQRNQMRP